MKKIFSFGIIFFLTTTTQSIQANPKWKCQIFPREDEISLESKSGAKIIFVTSDPANPDVCIGILPAD
jgi:hypothetical protein